MPLANDVANFNNQWFDTLTARLGYAVQPNWLLYFQGGAAWGHTSTNITTGWFANWPDLQHQNRLDSWWWR